MTSLKLDGTECWLPVVGYAGRYEVSNLGRVRSIERTLRKTSETRGSYDYVVPPRIMRLSPRSGYPSTTLYRDGVKIRLSVHRLVVEAFVGPIPNGMCVCHVDGDRTNNRATNLRIDTHAANSADMIGHGRSLVGQRNHLSKLTPDAIRTIREAQGVLTQRQLARRFGVSKAAVGYAQRGITWRHIDV